MEGEKGQRLNTMKTGIWATLAWVLGAIFLTPAVGSVQTVRVRETLTTANVRHEESNLADVIVDAVRAAGGAEIGFVAATSFAEVTLQAGSVPVEDFERALVFRGDTVVVLRLTGEQILRALEHSFGLYPGKSAAFLQVSGITVTADGTAPRGERIKEVRVGKELLDKSRSYTVAMPAPLAGGALVYSRAWNRENIERETRITLGEAVRQYVGGLSEIDIKPGERIVVRK